MIECRSGLQCLPQHLLELKVTHLSRVTSAFDRIVAVRGASGTTASKTLSAMRPSLFVMWDEPIAWRYGFTPNSAGYVRYLWLMASSVRRICKQVGVAADRAGAGKIEQMVSRTVGDRAVPLAKLLDQWNWMRVTVAGK